VLIGIAGKKRSGKDTAARALVAQLGFRQIAFADPLKALAASFLGLPVEMVRDDAFKYGTALAIVRSVQSFEDATFRDFERLNGREVLQRLGTAARETFGRNFWVERAMESVRVAEDVVFSDVRYWSELYAIEMAGGLVIRLNRVDGAESNDAHPSENELPSRDSGTYAEVFNCTSAEEAAARVVEWVKLKRNGGKAC
jgi:hypothetical protein